MQLRICIDVDDIERAIAFYTQGLQLQLGRRLRSDWCELLGGPCAIDLLCEPPYSAPLGEEHPQRRSFKRHWTPVHLDFVVDDIDAALPRLLAAGADAWLILPTLGVTASTCLSFRGGGTTRC